LGFCTSWAIDHRGDGPEWLEVVEVDLEIPRLRDDLAGVRIVHASDLHCSRTVSGEYLRRCVDRINALEPDIVVLTGDFITHDHRGQFRRKIMELVSEIDSNAGVFACLGNHDYGVGSTFGRFCHKQARRMAGGIAEAGVTVLRNESAVLELGCGRLWIVGLGDLWADDLEPDRAFDGVADDDTVIVLAHNPDSVGHLGRFEFDAVMSGHTHGVSVDWRVPGGKLRYARRHYCSGMYEVGGRKLYVNRGLGRLGKAFFNTRPEITIYKLR